jgi:hypothetical protein
MSAEGEHGCHHGKSDNGLFPYNLSKHCGKAKMTKQNQSLQSPALSFGEHVPSFSNLLLSAATIAYLIPAYFACLYPEYIAFDGLIFLFVATIFFCIILTSLVIVYSALVIFRVQWLACFFSLFCLAWAFLTGFVFPLIQKGAMMDPDQIATNKINFICVAILATAICLLAIKSRVTFWKLSTLLSLLAPLILFSIIALSRVRHMNNDLQYKKAGALSSQNNIIVLSFDGIPGNIIADMINNKEEVMLEFKDFIFFKEVIATSPGTVPSTRSELFGNINFRAIAPTEAQLTEKLGLEHLIINNTDDDVVTYDVYNEFNTNENNKMVIEKSVFSSSRYLKCIYFLNISLARVGTCRLPALVKRFLDCRMAEWLSLSFLRRRIAWQQHLLDDREVLDNIINKLTTSAHKYSLRFLHFEHTHFPIHFDAEGQMRSTSEAWYNENQNYQGLYNLSRFALRQAAELLRKLKSLGIYDSAFIVLKSDHGAPTTYFNAPPYDLKIKNHSLWGYDRYRPMLMIKNINVKQPALLIDSRFATLGDLAKTVCVARAHPDKNCTRFPGVNLLAPNLVVPQDRWVYIDVVRDETSTFMFDTHTTISIDRTKGFLDSLRERNLVND